MAADRGFIAVARDLFDHTRFAKEPFTEREAWIWMIAEAAWKPTSARVGRVTIQLERGQLAFSTRFLAEKWRWSEARVRRFLDRLQGDAQNDALATHQTTQSATQITICKHDDYQSSRRSERRSDVGENDAAIDAKKNKDKPVTTPEAEASVADARPPRSGPSRKIRLPAEAELTPDMLADALKATLTEDEARSEFPRFCDHHRAKGSVMADWRAAWRTWCSNALKFAAKSRGPPPTLPFPPSSRNGQQHAPGTPGPVTPETVDRLKQRIRSSLAGSFDPEAVGDERDHSFAPVRRVHGAAGGQH